MNSIASRIVCLGWGSLIWDPRRLRLKERARPWHTDGPELPVEFARQSHDGRMTLVLVPSGENVSVLWTELDVSGLTEARKDLGDREWEGRDPADVVGIWSPTRSETSLHSDLIGKWAARKGFDGVVWTKLPPKFAGRVTMPSGADVVDYLISLRGEKRALAEQYVRQTPPQILTPYRRAIENQLKWTYEGADTDSQIQISTHEA